MKIMKYLTGVLLAALGASLALDGVVLAWNHDAVGLGSTALGTASAATGALAWDKSFTFVPSGWSKKFYFVFLLPVVVFYVGLPVSALTSYDPGEREVFWLVPFLVLSVAAWYWALRRVLRGHIREFTPAPYVPNEQRDWFMLFLANIFVPLFTVLNRYAERVDTPSAVVVGISCVLMVNVISVFTVHRLRRQLNLELPKYFASVAAGLTLVGGLLVTAVAYW